MKEHADGAGEPGYGIDAPGFLWFAGAFGAYNLAVAVWTRSLGSVLAAGAMLSCLGCFLHTTRRGKFGAWRDILDGLDLRGDERVLDLGCGRGAVLFAVAKRLPAGRAVGIDIWSRADQSGNSAAATRRNGRAEGVADRTKLLTADMTALPFASGSFDLITSSLAIHNIRGWKGRQDAIDEAVRVLRPGGRVALADVRTTRRYATRLSALGMVDVERRNLGWRMWWGGPWGSTRLVTATKATRNGKRYA